MKKRKQTREERYFEIWLSHYRELEKYKMQHGDILVSEDFKCSDGFCLGDWLGLQRNQYRKGELDFDREELLNQLEIVWNVYTDTWEKRYAEAEVFYKEHGHLNVVYNYITQSETPLGTWISKQKKLKKQGKLEDWKIERLEALNIVWELKKDIWETHFAMAKAYYKKHGNLLIPVNYVVEEENFCLGRWIVKQRQKYKAGRLSTSRIKRLEKIGMVWVVRVFTNSCTKL